jgi:hypothetical protein
LGRFPAFFRPEAQDFPTLTGPAAMLRNRALFAAKRANIGRGLRADLEHE